LHIHNFFPLKNNSILWPLFSIKFFFLYRTPLFQEFYLINYWSFTSNNSESALVLILSFLGSGFPKCYLTKQHLMKYNLVRSFIAFLTTCSPNFIISTLSDSLIMLKIHSLMFFFIFCWFYKDWGISVFILCWKWTYFLDSSEINSNPLSLFLQSILTLLDFEDHQKL
jgi:hypothetical protein